MCQYLNNSQILQGESAMVRVGGHNTFAVCGRALIMGHWVPLFSPTVGRMILYRCGDTQTVTNRDAYSEATLTNTHIEPVSQDSDPSRLISPPKRTRTTYHSAKRLLRAGAIPLVSLLLPLFAHAGVFAAIIGIFDEEPKNAAIFSPQNAQTEMLLRATAHIDSNPSQGGGSIVVHDGALVAEGNPDGVAGDMIIMPQNGEISVYMVREGDSLSQIAEMFGVTANTILWANDLRSANLIKPGDSLIILPVSGVRYTVKKGDSVASIAKTYAGDADDIISYNGLASASDVVVGQTIVIPGGKIAPPPAPKKTATKVRGAVPSVPISGGYFLIPVLGAVRTQGIHGYNGIDLGATAGTAIRAAAAGEVIISKGTGWNGGYGSYIVIKHANGTQTLYAHTSTNYVSAGQSVAQGDSIGAVGSTGQSTGPHLHFEVRGAANPF